MRVSETLAFCHIYAQFSQRLQMQATVDDLKDRFWELKPKYYPSRQRWNLINPETKRPGTLLEGKKRLAADYGLIDGSALVFKDLGAQIGYRTVFFWEYFGPLMIYPLFYLFPGVLYPWTEVDVFPRAPVQTLACLYWIFHYAKRIFETFYVHKFSHATMPLRNLFKNCTYYWIFAAFVSYFVNHPLYTAPPRVQTYFALTIALVCQATNYKCHVILSNLRLGSTREAYVIPRGFLFDIITCPNYTAEVCGWIAFSVATQALPAFIFAIVGAGQMAIWAAGKHARLRKIFDGRDGREKYPRRWIMLPPVF